jgi:hypothetical protein
VKRLAKLSDSRNEVAHDKSGTHTHTHTHTHTQLFERLFSD